MPNVLASRYTLQKRLSAREVSVYSHLISFSLFFHIRGSPWSHQSPCAERMQQSRESSRFTYRCCSPFLSLFFSLPSGFFQASALVFLWTWRGAREWIPVWGQMWAISDWIIDAVRPGLNNGFSLEMSLYKISFMFDVAARMLDFSFRRDFDVQLQGASLASGIAIFILFFLIKSYLPLIKNINYWKAVCTFFFMSTQD